MSATLQIVRISRLTDAVWPYRVVVDGEPVGKVRNDETVRIPVAPGPHTLQLRSLHIIGRRLGLASPAVTFDLAAGETLEFVCKPPPAALALAHWIRSATGDRTGWITLTQAPRDLRTKPDHQGTEVNVAVPAA
jgi:hypothetical protein